VKKNDSKELPFGKSGYNNGIDGTIKMHETEFKLYIGVKRCLYDRPISHNFDRSHVVVPIGEKL